MFKYFGHKLCHFLEKTQWYGTLFLHKNDEMKNYSALQFKTKHQEDISSVWSKLNLFKPGRGKSPPSPSPLPPHPLLYLLAWMCRCKNVKRNSNSNCYKKQVKVVSRSKPFLRKINHLSFAISHAGTQSTDLQNHPLHYDCITQLVGNKAKGRISTSGG